MFSYIPKKSKDIYKEKIAHRGFHLKYPENTLSAYMEAINKKYAIEIDIRLTKDNHIICLHDRHIRRLLGSKGKTSNLLYEEIKKYKVLESNEYVPKFIDVLGIVDGKIPLLIEVKGIFGKKFQNELIKELEHYDGKIYFHAKNLLAYLKLKKIWGDKVFWVLNPLRKRFNFIKNRQYRKIKTI